MTPEERTLTLTVLVDDSPGGKPGLITEHGLARWIEADGRRGVPVGARRGSDFMRSRDGFFPCLGLTVNRQCSTVPYIVSLEAVDCADGESGEEGVKVCVCETTVFIRSPDRGKSNFPSAGQRLRRASKGLQGKSKKGGGRALYPTTLLKYAHLLCGG